MADNLLPQKGESGFEEIKLINHYEAEYWSARALQSVLGYRHWRSFETAIRKAITSCERSGNDPSHHFARARKMVELGSGSEQAESCDSAMGVDGNRRNRRITTRPTLRDFMTH